ncbi:head GIN domain-containing protein [Aureitalea marina]|uniref:Chaperonin n=1 Tax=Aureitalea marina TaxID=930804 RepID=A0A2S7KS79_9FLAO|nr:head GIN domain-containing protein [Aureitalea marina]PQB05457.1 chaperonin [Aureitalea marina]
MKKLLFVLALIACSAQAQRTITKDVGDFDMLKVYDLIEINLIQSDENRVVIKGHNTDDVRVINQNGKLKLRMEIDTRFDGSRTFIEVYYTDIKTIDSNEGARIVVNQVIEQDEIELRAQEGGMIRVGLDVDRANIKAVTGGIIEARGLAKSQEISLNTGGIFEGMDLRTKRTKIGIMAAGEAEVNASDLVDLKITAGGDIYIYGNPKEIDEKRFAGGRVKVMN